MVPHAHHQELPRRPQDQDSGQNGQTAEHEALWVSDQNELWDMIGLTAEHEALWVSYQDSCDQKNKTDYCRFLILCDYMQDSAIQPYSIKLQEYIIANAKFYHSFV